MPTEHSYGFVVAYRGEDADRFLLVRQKLNWSIPKGHIEAGETPLECARRELEEETGISGVTIIPGHAFTESYTFERDGVPTQKINTFFLATISTMEGVRAQEGEILECRFCTALEAQELFVYQNPKRVLAEAGEILKGIPRT